MAIPKKDTIIEVVELDRTQLEVQILGVTPLLCNRMSEKARRTIFSPQPKVRGKQKKTLKHYPLEEFRSSPYTLPHPNAPTYLAVLAVWFKRAMMTAALDIPGTTKSQIGRILRVEGERLPLYGIPCLKIDIVREKSINRTPDIRTRACVREWACCLTITFPESIIKTPSVMNLLSAAGQFNGIGDWRTEKGSANFGSFILANENDEQYQRILAEGGREAQESAMREPACYDDETEDLLHWWEADARQRGFEFE